MIETMEFKIELETISPLRIGGKKDPFSAIDSPVVKIGEKIVIPGSTLKGALRQEIERYLIEKYSQIEGMKPCIPSSERTISEDERKLIESGKYKGESCAYPVRNETLTQKDYICPACYLLGAQGLVGFVTVPFLTTNILPTELYGIRIDRAKGVAAERTNREYQIIPQGAIFTGTLTILIKDDIRSWELGKPRNLKEKTLGDKWLQGNSNWSKEKIIKELIVERLKNIKVLGSMKSAGAGKIEIKIHPIQQ